MSLISFYIDIAHLTCIPCYLSQYNVTLTILTSHTSSMFNWFNYKQNTRHMMMIMMIRYIHHQHTHLHQLLYSIDNRCRGFSVFLFLSSFSIWIARTSLLLLRFKRWKSERDDFKRCLSRIVIVELWMFD